MGDVVYGDFLTRLDLPPERVLDSAKNHGMSKVIIIGYDTDGREYFSSSTPNRPEMLYLLERFKMMLLDGS